jgi:hypothetical protein
MGGVRLKKPESPAEVAASTIVSAVTGCTTRRLDPGGGPTQLVDYALLSGDGKDIGVLEVTSITDEGVETFWSAKTREYRGWEDRQLRKFWAVSVQDASVPLKGLRAVVTPILLGLEREDVVFACAEPRVYLGNVRVLPPEVVEVGVVEVRALPKRGDGEGGVYVNVMPWGGAYGIETLTVAVETVAGREDNRTKLRGDFERRELFIWVNPPSAALSALTTFCDELHAAQVASARPPKLVDEVSAVWAAAWPRDYDSTLALALWRGDRSGWRVLNPPVAAA